MASLSVEDKKWRAESDARTLIEAKKILNDKSRKSSTLKEVKVISKEAQETLKNANSIAKSGVSTRSTRGRNIKKK